MLQFGAYTNLNRVENTLTEPMPPALADVVRALVRRGVINEAEAFDSCCINLFEQGQWLPAHVDNAKFARPFVSVSLVSEQRVVFTRQDNADKAIWLAVGSALRVDSDAADEWLHEIPPVTARRVSLTFRRLSEATKLQFAAADAALLEQKVSKGEQKRQAKEQAKEAKRVLKKAAKMRDAPQPPAASEEEQEAAKRSQRSTPYQTDGGAAASASKWAPPAVEVEHVRKVYDCVAEQWHGTRYKAWPRVADFVREVCSEPGALVGDIGCGNGKNAGACFEAGSFCVACDISLKLVEIAHRETRDMACDAFGADALTLPIRSNSLDAALCIAVLHHISTPERRLRTVSECVRVLRPGGEALFYAWALEQREFESRSGHRFETPDVLVPFHFRTHGEYYDEASLEAPSHAVVDTAKRALVLQRFCHVYAEGELEAIVAQLDGVRIRKTYYDQGNWAVIVTKL